MKKIGELKFWLKQALWFVPCAYVANFVYAVSSEQTGGTFGDTFGAANALFSGTALLMLVLAVILQREELEQVKEERNDTRKLLEGQERITKKQEEALKKQSFEQSFFSLVRLISEERRALNSAVSYNAKVSIARRASSDAKNYTIKNVSLDGWEISAYISKFGTVSRLLIAAFGLLDDLAAPRKETLVYVSTLHALLDSEFAHVLAVLASRWQEGDPRVISTIENLQVRAFLDEEFATLYDECFSSRGN